MMGDYWCDCMEECCPLQEGEEGDFMEEDELGDDGTQEEPDSQ